MATLWQTPENKSRLILKYPHVFLLACLLVLGGCSGAAPESPTKPQPAPTLSAEEIEQLRARAPQFATEKDEDNFNKIISTFSKLLQNGDRSQIGPFLRTLGFEKPEQLNTLALKSKVGSALTELPLKQSVTDEQLGQYQQMALKAVADMGFSTEQPFTVTTAAEPVPGQPGVVGITDCEAGEIKVEAPQESLTVDTAADHLVRTVHEYAHAYALNCSAAQLQGALYYEGVYVYIGSEAFAQLLALEVFAQLVQQHPDDSVLKAAFIKLLGNMNDLAESFDNQRNGFEPVSFVALMRAYAYGQLPLDILQSGEPIFMTKNGWVIVKAGLNENVSIKTAQNLYQGLLAATTPAP